MIHAGRATFVVCALLVLYSAPLGASSPEEPAPAQVSAGAADSLETMLRRDPASLRVETHADGSATLDLMGGYRNVMIAVTRDGRHLVTCVDSIEHARKLMGDRPRKVANDGNLLRLDKQPSQHLIEAAKTQLWGR